MKHIAFSLMAIPILLSACMSGSTATMVAPSPIPTVTFELSPTSTITVEPTKLSTPTLTSTTEPSKTPTVTPTITATPRPELSWQQAFNMLVNLVSDRAVLDKDGVFVNNLKYSDYNGMTAKVTPLDGPFGVAVQFNYQGAGYGSINLSDQFTANPWWKGMRRLWIKSEKDVIHLDIYDGTSDQRIGYFPLRTLDPNSRFYVIFSDAQGKRLTVLSEKGVSLQELDITKLGQGALANGLFPAREMYAGFTITPDSQMRVKELSLLAPPTSNLFKFYETKELSTPPLKELARQRGLRLGAEIDLTPPEFYYDARYQQIVAREFDGVTGGYGFSWTWGIHKNSFDFDWTRPEQVANFAKAHGLKLTGDLLFTSEPTADWLLNGGFSKDQLLGILDTHIQTVAKRYKGTVTEWWVVSEADYVGPTTNGGWFAGFANNKFWNQKVGADLYIPLAFRSARQADPTGLLVYVHDGNEMLNAKSDFEYNYLAQLKQKGVPIDAIGFEMNLQASNFKNDADIQAWKSSVIQNMRRFGELGLQVVITELNVNVGNVEGKTRDEKLDLQAKVYKAAIESCLESNGICKIIYLGGFTDAASWLYYPDYPYGKAEAPNILDEHYNPKPAYFAIRDALAGK
jgi:endo-1,4-beta-xylanase